MPLPFLFLTKVSDSFIRSPQARLLPAGQHTVPTVVKCFLLNQYIMHSVVHALPFAGRVQSPLPMRLNVPDLSSETLFYSVWRCCFTFFETVEAGRVHSCFQKSLRLAKRNNCAFQNCHLISASLDNTDFLRCRTYQRLYQQKIEMIRHIAGFPTGQKFLFSIVVVRVNDNHETWKEKVWHYCS